MSFIDFTVDTAIDWLMAFTTQRPESVRQFLLADVLQTVSVSGGLV